MYYLPYPLFLELYYEAQEINDIDMYIAERGWQDWMNSYDTDIVVQSLRNIYSISSLTFSGLRKTTGLSQVKMASAYGLKRRTIESWESGDRTPPEHDRTLYSYIIFLEIMNQGMPQNM